MELFIEHYRRGWRATPKVEMTQGTGRLVTRMEDSGEVGTWGQCHGDKGSGQGLRGMEAALTVSEHQPVMPVRAFFTPCFDKQLSGSIVTCPLLPLEALRGMGT